MTHRGAPGNSQWRQPPSAHRTVLSELRVNWHIRPGHDWPAQCAGSSEMAIGGSVGSDKDSTQGLELKLRGLSLQSDRYLQGGPSARPPMRRRRNHRGRVGWGEEEGECDVG